MTERKRNNPGGPMAAKQLSIVFMTDRSGSMKGEKIQALNYAIPEVVAALQEEIDSHAGVSVTVWVVSFNDVATWHIGGGTPLAEFAWKDLRARGRTAMGHAFRLVSEALRPENMPAAYCPPVIVLVTDGQATDKVDDGLAHLLENPNGRIAVRVPIAIGDKKVNYDLLNRFKSQDTPVLTAKNADQLRTLVIWETLGSVQGSIGSRPVDVGETFSVEEIEDIVGNYDDLPSSSASQETAGKRVAAWWRV